MTTISTSHTLTFAKRWGWIYPDVQRHDVDAHSPALHLLAQLATEQTHQSCLANHFRAANTQPYKVQLLCTIVQNQSIGCSTLLKYPELVLGGTFQQVGVQPQVQSRKGWQDRNQAKDNIRIGANRVFAQAGLGLGLGLGLYTTLTFYSLARSASLSAQIIPKG